MKITVNDYEPKDIIRIIREWTELTQSEFGKSVGLHKMVVQSYEGGRRRWTGETLMRIAKIHGLRITIEKI